MLSGSKYYEGFTDGGDHACGGGSYEFELEEESEVYCKITGGNYKPYGMICVHRIE